MRFATYQRNGSTWAGAVSDAGIHPLPAGTTVLDLVRRGLPAALEAGAAALTGPAVPVADVRLLPPLEAPTVRDFVAFEEHVEGVRKAIDGVAGVVPEWYEAPTFYFTNPYALIGAHDDVAVPPGSRRFDFELEVAVDDAAPGAAALLDGREAHQTGGATNRPLSGSLNDFAATNSSIAFAVPHWSLTSGSLKSCRPCSPTTPAVTIPPSSQVANRIRPGGRRRDPCRGR